MIDFRRYRFSLSPAVSVIAGICVAIFIFDLTAPMPVPYVFAGLFALQWETLCDGYWWQPLTYIFLHGGLFHLLCNMITLVCFGTTVESMIGTRRFWQLFLSCGIIAGLGWILIDNLAPRFLSLIGNGSYALQQGSYCVGASGGLMGVVGAFAAFCPEERITFLLFFVIPIRMKARTLAILLVASTLIGPIWNHQIAYSAHFFGGFAGYFIAKWWLRRWSFRS